MGQQVGTTRVAAVGSGSNRPEGGISRSGSVGVVVARAKDVTPAPSGGRGTVGDTPTAHAARRAATHIVAATPLALEITSASAPAAVRGPRGDAATTPRATTQVVSPTTVAAPPSDAVVRTKDGPPPYVTATTTRGRDDGALGTAYADDWVGTAFSTVGKGGCRTTSMAATAYTTETDTLATSPPEKDGISFACGTPRSHSSVAAAAPKAVWERKGQEGQAPRVVTPKIGRRNGTGASKGPFPHSSPTSGPAPTHAAAHAPASDVDTGRTTVAATTEVSATRIGLVRNRAACSFLAPT